MDSDNFSTNNKPEYLQYSDRAGNQVSIKEHTQAYKIMKYNLIVSCLAW